MLPPRVFSRDQNIPKPFPKRSTFRSSKLSKIIPKRSILHSPKLVVSADKTSVVSAGKTSVVSADTTDVLSADTTDVLPAATTDVLSADTTSLVLCKVDPLGTIFESLDLLEVDLYDFGRFCPLEKTRGGNTVRTAPPERKTEPYGASYDQKASWRRPILGLKVPLAPGLGMTWPQVDFGVILGSIFRDSGIHFPSKCAKMQVPLEGCSKSSLSEFTSGALRIH